MDSALVVVVHPTHVVDFDGRRADILVHVIDGDVGGAGLRYFLLERLRFHRVRQLGGEHLVPVLVFDQLRMFVVHLVDYEVGNLNISN